MKNGNPTVPPSGTIWSHLLEHFRFLHSKCLPLGTCSCKLSLDQIATKGSRTITCMCDWNAKARRDNKAGEKIKNFSKLMTDAKPRIRKVYWITSRIKKRETYTWAYDIHNVFKLRGKTRKKPEKNTGTRIKIQEVSHRKSFRLDQSRVKYIKCWDFFKHPKFYIFSGPTL